MLLLLLLLGFHSPELILLLLQPNSAPLSYGQIRLVISNIWKQMCVDIFFISFNVGLVGLILFLIFLQDFSGLTDFRVVVRGPMPRFAGLDRRRLIQTVLDGELQ